MKIGIVSDSHGKAKRLQAAVEILARHGAEAIVHCGDVGAGDCIALLGRAGVPAYVVSGNMDRHTDRLLTAAETSGVSFRGDVVEVPLGDGRCLVVTHGHDEGILNELILDEQFPYVCHGHTHRVRDERVGAVRVICPGALRHPRHPRHPTVAVLDTDTETLEFVEVRSSRVGQKHS